MLYRETIAEIRTKHIRCWQNSKYMSVKSGGAKVGWSLDFHGLILPFKMQTK